MSRVEEVKNCLETCVCVLSDACGCVRRINLGSPTMTAKALTSASLVFSSPAIYIYVHRFCRGES